MLNLVCLTECDHESSTLRRPWPIRSVAIWKKKIRRNIIFGDLSFSLRGVNIYNFSALDCDIWILKFLTHRSEYLQFQCSGS